MNDNDNRHDRWPAGASVLFILAAALFLWAAIFFVLWLIFG